MRRVDGGEACVLTRGDLAGTPCPHGNLFRKEELNSQKSAEAIVPK
jgi:hypothetical protein